MKFLKIEKRLNFLKFCFDPYRIIQERRKEDKVNEDHNIDRSPGSSVKKTGNSCFGRKEFANRAIQKHFMLSSNGAAFLQSSRQVDKTKQDFTSVIPPKALVQEIIP